MKRDMSLIRLLLLRLERDEEVELSAYSEDQVIYHSALAVEAGLVDGAIRTDQHGYPNGVASIRLTWKGHDFLDAARNESVWKKATGVVRSKGLSLTFDLLKELLTSTIRHEIGL
jgi:Hypothetical protein (DUF2513)